MHNQQPIRPSIYGHDDILMNVVPGDIPCSVLAYTATGHGTLWEPPPLHSYEGIVAADVFVAHRPAAGQ